MKDPLGSPNVVTVCCQLALAVRRDGCGNLGNPLVDDDNYISTRSGGDAFCCGRVLADFRRVMHHEIACKSEFQVRFLEWGPASLAQW